MKKILAIISIGALATMSYGQGTVNTSTSTAAYAMYTNTAVGLNFGGPGTGGVSGKTGPLSSGQIYYYQLLIQAYTGGGVVDNPNAANGWVTAQFASSPSITNSAAPVYGAVAGPGGAAGAPVANWGAPTGAAASQGGTEMYFMLVGWSSSLGSSWTTVYNDIVNNTWTGVNYVGWSAVGYDFAGGGPNNVPAVSLFGGTGLTAGVQMFETPIPEPSTMVLAGLGGLSLLLFRRRK
jgi:hypothetical protein